MVPKFVLSRWPRKLGIGAFGFISGENTSWYFKQRLLTSLFWASSRSAPSSDGMESSVDLSAVKQSTLGKIVPSLVPFGISIGVSPQLKIGSDVSETIRHSIADTSALFRTAVGETIHGKIV
ncbi:3-isopropylmalate dehydratase small subunit [Frankliniella fusca]|uniref:3-isopropylmalate dehydratase small subunit n=1 Tax=Frankliniella fusca TaxID=407009 RepID=A0AAE1GX41_9NEOP|nr:3-isopropylmalate dehydratase small subunit [Frankliniella fusca]